MKNAILIAPFHNDKLMVEFYNLLASETEEFGYSLTGIDLSEVRRVDKLGFPLLSSGAYLPKPSLVPLRGISLFVYRVKQGVRWIRRMVRPVLRPIKRAIVRNRVDPTQQCYAEMQCQGGNQWVLAGEIQKLARFRRRLEHHCKAAQVNLVILNHQFSGYHLIARDFCVGKGLRFFFWHPGFLPGTMCFDERGQLAESEINEWLRNDLDRCGEAEERLGEDYRRWANARSYVRPGKKSTSNESCLEQIKTLAKPFKKVLLVIGANDHRTGMQPDSYSKARLHSPFIRSSAALFKEVVDHTDDSTLVLFKPHPNLTPNSSGVERDSERSYRVFDVTIKDLLPMIDATVTLCSTGVYEALLCGIPSVIVGNLPGSDLGICHKPGGENLNLKEVLDDALTNGISETMERRMNIFIGYLLKHYFFAAGSGACPLVERDLKTALSELFQGRRSAATSGSYGSGQPRSQKTAPSLA